MDEPLMHKALPPDQPYPDRYSRSKADILEENAILLGRLTALEQTNRDLMALLGTIIERQGLHKGPASPSAIGPSDLRNCTEPVNEESSHNTDLPVTGKDHLFQERPYSEQQIVDVLSGRIQKLSHRRYPTEGPVADFKKTAYMAPLPGYDPEPKRIGMIRQAYGEMEPPETSEALKAAKVPDTQGKSLATKHRREDPAKSMMHFVSLQREGALLLPSGISKEEAMRADGYVDSQLIRLIVGDPSLEEARVAHAEMYSHIFSTIVQPKIQDGAFGPFSIDCERISSNCEPMGAGRVIFGIFNVAISACTDSLDTKHYRVNVLMDEAGSLKAVTRSISVSDNPPRLAGSGVGG